MEKEVSVLTSLCSWKEMGFTLRRPSASQGLGLAGRGKEEATNNPVQQLPGGDGPWVSKLHHHTAHRGLLTSHSASAGGEPALHQQQATQHPGTPSMTMGELLNL